MLEVSFCGDKQRDPWLTVHLASVPAVGETIRFRERPDHTRPSVGRVVRREWDVVEKEPGRSWVTVFVAFD